jgi:hypothetical protein
VRLIPDPRILPASALTLDEVDKYSANHFIRWPGALFRFDKIDTAPWIPDLTRFLDANLAPPRIKSGAGFRLKALWNEPRRTGITLAMLDSQGRTTSQNATVQPDFDWRC